MNAQTFHPESYRREHKQPQAPAPEKLYPASHSFLEPRGEGILFAVLCMLCSALIYCTVMLVRFLT